MIIEWITTADKVLKMGELNTGEMTFVLFYPGRQTLHQVFAI